MRNAIQQYEAAFALIPGSTTEQVAHRLTSADWNTLADDLAMELGRKLRNATGADGLSLETIRFYAARIADCEARIKRK